VNETWAGSFQPKMKVKNFKFLFFNSGRRDQPSPATEALRKERKEIGYRIMASDVKLINSVGDRIRIKVKVKALKG